MTILLEKCLSQVGDANFYYSYIGVFIVVLSELHHCTAGQLALHSDSNYFTWQLSTGGKKDCSLTVMYNALHTECLQLLCPSSHPQSHSALTVHCHGRESQSRGFPLWDSHVFFFPVAILKYSFSKLEVINPKYKLRCFFCFIIFKNGIPSYLVRSIYKKFWISFFVSE